MTLTPITVACPACGSSDIFYSCKPECCFNHVCNHCYTTFELETERVGECDVPFDAPPEPDSTHPTAPCARCHECRVFAISRDASNSSTCLCVSCKALLRITITNIQKG